MAATRRNWERREIMFAIELYCRTPFGKIDKRNSAIIALADVIGRSPSAVCLKLANFAALDPTLDRQGMSGFSKADEEIWAEFFADPAEFLDTVDRMRASDYSQKLFESSTLSVREGRDVERLVKTRKHQDFFRRSLLASYNGTCAVTGINNEELLIASHIIPWAEDEALRLDPRNGILLNALHDRAFDRHLISFEDDLSLIVSPKLNLPEHTKPFFEGKRLSLPERFRPAPDMLRRHRDRFAEKAAT